MAMTAAALCLSVFVNISHKMFARGGQPDKCSFWRIRPVSSDFRPYYVEIRNEYIPWLREIPGIWRSHGEGEKLQRWAGTVERLYKARRRLLIALRAVMISEITIRSITPA